MEKYNWYDLFGTTAGVMLLFWATNLVFRLKISTAPVWYSFIFLATSIFVGSILVLKDIFEIFKLSVRNELLTYSVFGIMIILLVFSLAFKEYFGVLLSIMGSGIIYILQRR